MTLDEAKELKERNGKIKISRYAYKQANFGQIVEILEDANMALIEWNEYSQLWSVYLHSISEYSDIEAAMEAMADL